MIRVMLEHCIHPPARRPEIEGMQQRSDQHREQVLQRTVKHDRLGRVEVAVEHNTWVNTQGVAGSALPVLLQRNPIEIPLYRRSYICID